MVRKTISWFLVFLYLLDLTVVGFTPNLTPDTTEGPEYFQIELNFCGLLVVILFALFFYMMEGFF